MITPTQRTRLIAEATRTLPVAVGKGNEFQWFKGYVQRGLAYRTIATIFMGGRSAEEVRGGYRGYNGQG